MAPNDAPFMIESNDELPARSGKKMGDDIMRDMEGSHENSSHNVPKLY